VTLINPFSRADRSPALQGKLTILRYPMLGDYESWAKLRRESYAHLQPWEPTWADDELSKLAYRRRMSRYAQDIRDDKAYPYWIFTPSGEFTGSCTLSNIRRGVSQMASLGYWTGSSYTGQGLMTDAITALLPHAFGALGLHRIEAACLPNNKASCRVLAKCGFAEEGFARRYLRINGEWRDHLLFALLHEDWRPGPQRR
jgi:ribosomal-protein-alanine N-acetyltransferase